MQSQHIVVVDDDPQIRHLLSTLLQVEGYRITALPNGAALRAHLAQSVPDLVVLDLMLPGEDGLQITRYLREHATVGIIILSAKRDIVDRVVGLEMGADDFVSKPFDRREFLARVRAVLRRTAERRDRRVQAAAPSPSGLGPWTIDATARRVQPQTGPNIALTGSEFALLTVFMAAPGEALDRVALRTALDGAEGGAAGDDPDAGPSRSIDILVARLRRKLDQGGGRSRHRPRIHTVRGVGYMLVLPPEPEAGSEVAD